jgi:methionine-rich copper-binding protein CopC
MTASPSVRCTVTGMRRLTITVTMTLLVALAWSAPAAAHTSFDSNLRNQRYELAPQRAEFYAETPVQLSTARAQLRYLGGIDVAVEQYLRTDVPTVELAAASGPEITTVIAFELPKLGAGTYAIDWEVTPVDDHAVRSLQLLVVTVGDDDPDSVPDVPTSGIDGAVDNSTSDGTNIPVVVLSSIIGFAAGFTLMNRLRRQRR